MLRRLRIVTVGGWSLILFTLLYLGMQVYLQVFFNYTVLLHGPDKEVLPLLLSGGIHLAVMLTIYSLIPLLLVPGAIGAFYAFREQSGPAMEVGIIFASFAILTFVLCLMRWPSINWYVALAYTQANPEQQSLLTSFLLATNTYLGTYLGGFVTSICAAIWFFITSSAMLRAPDFPKWIGYTGRIAGIYLVILVINNFKFFPPVIDAVIRAIAPIDAVWLLVFGIGLLVHRRSDF